MSSRWISISFSGWRPCQRVAVDLRVDGLDQRGLAHAARAPEQDVVGRQPARRSARCSRCRVSRARSMPFSSTMSTRFTVGTGASRGGAGCQTKASAAVKSRLAAGGGRKALQRSRRCASRSAVTVGRRAVAWARLMGSIPETLGMRALARRRIAMLTPVPVAADCFQRQASRDERRQFAFRRNAGYSPRHFSGRPSPWRMRRRATSLRRDPSDHPCLCPEPPAPAGGDDMFVQLVPFVLIFIIMYFLIIRPQQKQRQGPSGDDQERAPRRHRSSPPAA